MTDVIFVTIVCAFFGICVAFVRACDRLIAATTEELTELDNSAKMETAAR